MWTIFLQEVQNLQRQLQEAIDEKNKLEVIFFLYHINFYIVIIESLYCFRREGAKTLCFESLSIIIKTSSWSFTPSLC